MIERPFRHHLRHVSLTGPAASAERLGLPTDILLALQNRHKLILQPTALLPFIERADEENLLLIADVDLLARGEGEWPQLRNALCRRAIADADAAQEVWTPLLDRLAERGVLQAASDDVANAAGIPIPSPSERLAQLKSWVQAQTMPEPLLDLLRFRAYNVWALVFREMRCFASELVDLALSSPNYTCELACNEALPDKIRVRLLELGKQSVLGETTGLGYKDGLVLLRRLASRGGGLSPGVRTWLIRKTKHRPQGELHMILADDVGITKTNAGRLQHRLKGESAVALIRRGVLTERQVCRFLDDRRTAWELLCHHRDLLTPERIRLIAQKHGSDPTFARMVLAARRTTMIAMRMIAQVAPPFEDIHLALVKRSKIRSDPEVRAALLRTPWPRVIVHLIPDATAEEYPILFNTLVRKDPRTALRVLAEYPPPPGSVFPAKTVQAMLSAEDRDARFAAIQLLAELDIVSPPGAPPTAERSASAPERAR